MAQHAAAMTKRCKWRVLETRAVRGFEADEGIDRIRFHEVTASLHRMYPVLGLEVRDRDRIGLDVEQVDDRRAEEPNVFCGEAHVIRVRLCQHDLYIEVGSGLRN